MQDFKKNKTSMPQASHAIGCEESSAGCRDSYLVTSSGLQASFAALSAVSLLLASCRKEDDLLYELNEVQLVSSAAEKTREKSNQQYVNILRTNLFQSGLTSSQAYKLDQLFQSIGDKELAKEVLISNFFNEPGVQMPTAEAMHQDIDGFVRDTYKRFLVREPNEAELTWVRNFIQSNPYMTPELVYFSFALSNEYQYY